MGAHSGGDILMQYRWEPLNYLLQTGLAQLGALSWQESGNDKDIFEYDPDWARYGRMEQADILRFIGVRDDDELVGYASVIITDNLHDKKVCCAIIQDIFILPEKRKNHAADNLLTFAESQLLDIGVQHIALAERLMVGSVGRWLKWRGYHSNERIWTKSLSARSIH